MRHERRAGGDRSWVSAHLFSQGNLDRVLTDLVAPLLDELRERWWADRGFFLRYWDGGPHIRLRVLPSCQEAAAAVRGLIEQRATAYFAHSPAPEVLSQEEYLHSAREIGAWEGVRPTERMYANNSVHFLPYVPEHHRYGQGATLELVEEHFSTSSELALDLLRGATGPEQRELAALCHLLLAWFLGAEDVRELAGRQLAKVSARRAPGTAETRTASDAQFLQPARAIADPRRHHAQGRARMAPHAGRQQSEAVGVFRLGRGGRAGRGRGRAVSGVSGGPVRAPLRQSRRGTHRRRGLAALPGGPCRHRS